MSHDSYKPELFSRAAPLPLASHGLTAAFLLLMTKDCRSPADLKFAPRTEPGLEADGRSRHPVWRSV